MAQASAQPPAQLGAYPVAGSTPLSRDQARAVFGQVMGLVAVTLGFLALGAYIGRDLSGGLGILFFVAAFACIFGLNIASARGRNQLAITLLDFNRLRRSGEDQAVPIAASIFLDVLNVFLFLLQIFGRD
jgi:FtsH-binding integral membrane protein